MMENGMTLDSLMQHDYNGGRSARTVGVQDSFSKIIEITKLQMRNAAKRAAEKNIERSSKRTPKRSQSA
jgi:hypothetical protein